jgi:ribosome-associated translation inhibitor RaiA
MNAIHKTERTVQITIQASNFPMTQVVRDHIKRRLDFALSTRREYIERILVRLSDVNGPRGGNDKCCRLQVTLPRLADVVVEDIEANLYVAIDRAADRASRTVARRLTRQRNKQRARLSLKHTVSSGVFKTD